MRTTPKKAMIEKEILAVVGVAFGFLLFRLMSRRLDAEYDSSYQSSNPISMGSEAVLEYPQSDDWNQGEKNIRISPANRTGLGVHSITIPANACAFEATKIIKSCLSVNRRSEVYDVDKLDWDDIDEIVDDYVRRRSTVHCECGERMYETNDGDYICPWCSRGISPEAVA